MGFSRNALEGQGRKDLSSPPSPRHVFFCLSLVVADCDK